MINYGFSIKGKSHSTRNMACQDANKVIQLNNGCSIGLVADGVGSAKSSDIGANIAVEKAGEYCNFCHCILHFFLFNVSIRNAFFRLRRSIRRRYCILFSIAQFLGRCKGFSGGFFGFIVNR